MKIFKDQVKTPSFSAPLLAAIKAGAKQSTPNLTHLQFANWIKANKGAVMLGLKTLTEVKIRKTNNPHTTIYKQSNFVGISGASYERAVIKTLENFGENANFKTAPLKWGQWVPGAENKLIINGGDYYLRLQSSGRQRLHSAPKVKYFDEYGRELDYESIKRFFIVSTSAKQDAAGLNRAEQIQVRNFKFENIKKVTIMGKTYRLVRC